MSDEQPEISDEELRELLGAALEEMSQPSELDPNVHYIDVDATTEHMGGLHTLLAMDAKTIEEEGILLAGHTLDDLRDLPDPIAYEILVEDEYGEVLDRRWLDGVGKPNLDDRFKFYGGAYLIEDPGEKDQPALREYITVGTTYADGTPLGDDIGFYPADWYDDIDAFVTDKFDVEYTG